MPKTKQKTNTIFNTLRIKVNKTAAEFENIESFRAFFMDRANSVKIYPNNMEMAGDEVRLRIKDKRLRTKKG